MPIDPSIALGYRGVEAPNQLAQFGQIAQIQNAQNQNALAQYQIEKARREDVTTNAMNELLAKHVDPTTGQVNKQALFQDLAAGKMGSQILPLQKTFAEQEKSAAELGKLKAEAATKQTELFRGQLNNVQNPAQAAAWVQAQYNDPILGPVVKQVPMEQALAGIPTDPKAFAEWKNQNALGMSKWVERNTMTAGEKAVDARARERLNAEMATGVLTPQSLDVAANVYLQTGQLPTGLGKSAANLRSQVMNRATELSTGKPAAEVAGGIVEAKQDVASRGKAVKDFATGKQGDAVRAFNTAVDHLDTMSKLASALENKDVRLFNTVGNAFAAAVGKPAPTDFDTAKSMVGGEVAKALTGSNMALRDREEVREALSRANSPEQLQSAIHRAQELMGGQLNSLELQYTTSTGRKDFNSKLTPRSKEVLQSLRGGAAPAAGAGIDTSNPLLK